MPSDGFLPRACYYLYGDWRELWICHRLPSQKKAKALSVGADWAFAFIGSATRHCHGGICRQFCRPPRVGGWRANRFAAQPRGHDNRPIPNITGSAQISTRYPLATTNHTGALYGTALGSADTHGQDVGDRLFRALALSASRSNSTYGSSSTVQPPSMMLLPCIKL